MLGKNTYNVYTIMVHKLYNYYILYKIVEAKIFGNFEYRTVQVLSRHDCFGQYLHRRGKEAMTRCWHCPRDQDSAQHTLEM